jgi:hypothetical protein
LRTIDEIEKEMSIAATHQHSERLWLEWFRTNAEGISEDRFKEICTAERDNRLAVPAPLKGEKP